MEITKPKAIVSNIAHFYDGQNIFISGATGEWIEDYLQLNSNNQ